MPPVTANVNKRFVAPAPFAFRTSRASVPATNDGDDLIEEFFDDLVAGANNLVNRLVDVGLLREITGYARNRRFRFDPYLRLFEETEEPVGDPVPR